ncbi:MAG: hypothetical protein MPN21_14145 [Thermoanaerobaculia bacterium]|nr:hypothetical protein [Thermoanaerobaculia bacterium]
MRFVASVLALAMASGIPTGIATAQETPSGDEALPLLVDVELSTDEITVGDRVEATLTVVWMGGDTAEPARFPTWQETWGRAEVLQSDAVVETDDASGRRIWRQKVTLTAFRPGEVELPSVTVVLPLTDRTVEATTEPTRFTVGSVLPEPAEPTGDPSQAGQPAQQLQAEIPEPKGPAATVGLDREQQNFFWSAGVLTALLAVCLFWAADAVAKQPAPAGDPARQVDPLRLLSPLDELKERLARLDPVSAAEPLHTGLSFAMRTYLGRRLRFRAVESTTTEIQRALRRAALSADVHHRVIRLLRDADAVKFARAEVDRDVAGRRLAEAGDVARQIEHEMAPTVRLEADAVETTPQAPADRTRAA